MTVTDRTSIAVCITVSDGASSKLYSNKACTSKIADNKLKLKTGVNTAYIKVTAQDGKTSSVYILKVQQK